MNAPDRIETARLWLRKPEELDADAIFTGWASDPDVTRYLGWPTHRSIEDARAFLRFALAEWNEKGCGAYLLVEGRRLVGSTGLHFETPWRAETGYLLARAAWGRGLATEALGAMVDVAPRIGLVRVEARCHVEHGASSRVLAKCGFVREAVHRRYEVFPNLGRDVAEDVERWARMF